MDPKIIAQQVADLKLVPEWKKPELVINRGITDVAAIRKRFKKHFEAFLKDKNNILVKD